MTYGIAMGALSDITMNWQLVPPAMGIVLVSGLCYLAGRAQQWHRSAEEREEAFVRGYNTATTSLFAFATRATKSIQAPPLMEAPRKEQPRKMIKGVAKVGRHSISTGELSSMQQTKTYTAWDEAHAA